MHYFQGSREHRPPGGLMISDMKLTYKACMCVVASRLGPDFQDLGSLFV